MTTETFQQVLARVRAGEDEAAAEVVRLYGPEVRRLVRVRLTDPNLRRAVDSADISQSVLAAFFVKVQAGAFDLNDPTDLARLFATMVRNKVFDHARRPANRDTRTAGSAVWAEAADDRPPADDVLADHELLRRVRELLTPDEWAVAERRVAGASWAVIGATAGVSGDAARKRHERAVERVCAALGLEPMTDA